MHRNALATLALALALVAPGRGEATLIDSFESGPFSLSRSTPGGFGTSVSTSQGHSLTGYRTAIGEYFDGATGTMSFVLAPQQGVDDGVVMTFPNGPARASCTYSGGPWDLTEGGTLNQITVRAIGGNPDTELGVTLYDDFGMQERTLGLAGSGNYHFLLSSFSVDVTKIEYMVFSVTAVGGEVVEIQNISVRNGNSFLYDVNTPPSYVYVCSSSEQPEFARGGPTAIGWDWAVDWPESPSFPGPRIQVTGVSGQNCSSVQFVGYDSGPGGTSGEMGMVDVIWQDPTFENGTFQLLFVTDPSAPFSAQLVGTPEVTMHPSGFVIDHALHVTGSPEIPDGTFHQRLSVDAFPGQELYLDWVDAIPYEGGSGVGYSLDFGITAAFVDTSDPILEMYTTSWYVDDAGETGVAPGNPQAPAALAAHPSVTSTTTTFVLPGAAGARGVIDVFDVTGRRIRRLPALAGRVPWNTRDENGARVPAGVYFARVERASAVARVVVIR